MEAPNTLPQATCIDSPQWVKPRGLSAAEVEQGLKTHGPNRLPEAKPTDIAVLFSRQFLSPLIYILLAAAAFSLWMEDYTDHIRHKSVCSA